MANKLEVSTRWTELMKQNWWDVFSERATKYSDQESLVFKDDRVTYEKWLEIFSRNGYTT